MKRDPLFKGALQFLALPDIGRKRRARTPFERIEPAEKRAGAQKTAET